MELFAPLRSDVVDLEYLHHPLSGRNPIMLYLFYSSLELITWMSHRWYELDGNGLLSSDNVIYADGLSGLSIT